MAEELLWDEWRKWQMLAEAVRRGDHDCRIRWEMTAILTESLPYHQSFSASPTLDYQPPPECATLPALVRTRTQRLYYLLFNVRLGYRPRDFSQFVIGEQAFNLAWPVARRSMSITNTKYTWNSQEKVRQNYENNLTTRIIIQCSIIPSIVFGKL